MMAACSALGHDHNCGESNLERVLARADQSPPKRCPQAAISVKGGHRARPPSPHPPPLPCTRLPRAPSAATATRAAGRGTSGGNESRPTAMTPRRRTAPGWRCRPAASVGVLACCSPTRTSCRAPGWPWGAAGDACAGKLRLRRRSWRPPAVTRAAHDRGGPLCQTCGRTGTGRGPWGSLSRTTDTPKSEETQRRRV